MTDNIKITVDLGKVPMVVQKVQRNRIVSRAGKAILLHLRSKLAPYPPVSRRPQAGQWSDAERRAFWAKLKAGEIEVPYRRGLSPGSESLGKRWQIKGSGNRQSLINNASYASLTQGRKQIPYHKGTGWNTTEDTINSERGAIGTIMTKETARELEP
jgi:hypothetical protein